jgi:hypothetical protein
MNTKNANAERGGHSIESLDDRKTKAAEPGAKDPHGRKMPQYTEEAPSHVQTSGIADVDEDGSISVDESETIPKDRPQ